PHAPAGSVGYGNGALPHHLAQRVVRGRGLTSGAMQGVDETARRHREPKMLSIEPHDLAQWQATLLVQMRGGGDRHGAELRCRGAERIGGLQRMPALHAAATLLTLANVHLERADDRADRRQVFLVLRSDAGEMEGAATVRTRRWQCGGVRLITPCRRRSSGAAPICRASPPPRAAATALRPVLRKRSGLAHTRPTGRLKLL